MACPMRTLNDIPLRDNDRFAIQQAVKILREQFPVEKVILFGSKARGDDDSESDIDLLVLTSRPVAPAERDRMVDAMYALQLERGVVFSRLVVPLAEWDHGLYQVLPIHAEIERDGVAA